MGNALIVIDMQVDFCSDGALAVAGGGDLIAPINAMMGDYDAVVLTQDWHPENHTSFADNHHGAEAFSLINLPYGPQVLWPRHCVIGSAGAELVPGLDTAPADLVLRKGFRPDIDSYSAFFENDRTTATGLAGYLGERGLSHLTFVGLALDFCVAWSAIDAVKLGFGATVVESACRAIDLDGSLEQARHDMRAAGVTIA